MNVSVQRSLVTSTMPCVMCRDVLTSCGYALTGAILPGNSAITSAATRFIRRGRATAISTLP